MLDTVAPCRPFGKHIGAAPSVAGPQGQWYTAAKSRGRDRVVAQFYWRLFAVTGSITAYLMYKKLALH
jgi:hypothetical protein